MDGKEILVNAFGIPEDELHTIKSVGSMLGNTKSLTITFSTISKDGGKGGSNRKSMPVGQLTDEQILKTQLEISKYINSKGSALAAMFDEEACNTITEEHNAKFGTKQGSLL